MNGNHLFSTLSIALASLMLTACGGGNSSTAADTTAPSVVLTAPHSSATAVPLNSTISAAFGEALDCASVSDTSLSLAAGAATVNGAVTCDGALVTFTPAAPMSPSTTYTAMVNTSVKDAAGNALATDYSWSFTTAESGSGSGSGSPTDTQAPDVLLVNPAPAAASVDLNASLVVAFSEDVDCATVSAGSFTLKDSANTGIDGSLACNGALATFTPASPLVRLTTYTATLSTGIKDVAGNALAAPYTWNFTALAPASPEVSRSFSTKTIHLTWPAVTGATSYRVQEKADAASGYAQKGAEISDTSVDLTVPVHLFDWNNAAYKIEACTSGGCTASQAIGVETGVASAIGRLALDGSSDLGSQTVLTRDGNTAFVTERRAINIYTRDPATNSYTKTGAIPFTLDIIRLAVSGDGLTLAAVVYNPVSGNYAIQTHVSDGIVWSLLQTTESPDFADVSIALNADGTRLLRGMPWATSDTGLVGLYERDGVAWTSIKSFTYPGTAPWPFFGKDVAISDDGNSVVILSQASPMETYSYHFDGTTWSAGSLVTDGGNSVEKLAMNADGTVLALGGYSRVAVFERAAVTDDWAEVAQLTSSSANQSYFGEQVAISTDGTVIAVGDPYDDGDGSGINPASASGISGSGAVFVYTRGETTWTEASFIKSLLPELDGNFGKSLTLTSDGQVMMVGAPGEQSTSGALYYY